MRRIVKYPVRWVEFDLPDIRKISARYGLNKYSTEEELGKIYSKVFMEMFQMYRWRWSVTPEWRKGAGPFAGRIEGLWRVLKELRRMARRERKGNSIHYFPPEVE